MCIFGTYRSDYTRHQVLLARLEQADIEVIECHLRLWNNDAEREHAASGGWMQFGFLWRVLKTYTQLIIKYLQQGIDYDVMLIGYPGHIDIFLGKLFCWFRKKPLVWDILLSIYLVSTERQLEKKSRFTIAGLHVLEKIATRLPDLILLETQAYINWFCEHYTLQKDRFRVAPLGADDRIFQPSPSQDSNTIKKIVLFYGTFHPNSGVLFIAEAALLLKENQNIKFELIGMGPDLLNLQQFLKANKLTNVELVNWMDKDLLIEEIAQADICLGSFGSTPQSYISIHNKIYESLAMAKAVITGDSPALREVMENGVHIILVERANPKALAEAILKLLADLRLKEDISFNGYRLFKEEFSNQILGNQLKNYIIELINQKSSNRNYPINL